MISWQECKEKRFIRNKKAINKEDALSFLYKAKRWLDFVIGTRNQLYTHPETALSLIYDIFLFSMEAILSHDDKQATKHICGILYLQETYHDTLGNDIIDTYFLLYQIRNSIYYTVDNISSIDVDELIKLSQILIDQTQSILQK